MKLTTLFLLAAFLQVGARGLSQQVSYRAKNEKIQNAFTAIEKQTGYVFFYRAQDLDKAVRIDVDINETTLKAALDKLLRNQPLQYRIEGKTVFISAKKDMGAAQLIPEPPAALPTVHGKITNEKGEPVADVSIAIKGGKVVGVTDSNGEFTLNNIADNATLVFSGVNIETHETKLSGRAELAITAKSKIVALEDVTIQVSTGYQTLSKERATGSFDFIDNKTLNQQVGTNILKRLEGVAPGILFDNNKVVKGVPKNNVLSVRGLSTINATIDPLIVLDGFIYEGDINNINPNNIENITVLKDAAATSIWGARAGNGVVVITSKEGQLNHKLQVSASMNVIVTEKPDLFYLRQMKSSDYIDVEQFLFNQGAFNSRINTKYQSLTPAVSVFLKKKNGLITASDSAGQIDALKAIDTRDQYLRYVYQPNVTQQYAVNLNGGTASNAYGFFLGYDHLAGELRNTNEKVNIGFNNLYKVSQNFTVSSKVLYTNIHSVSGAGGYNSITPGTRQVPYFRLADDNGVALPVATIYSDAYVDTAGGGKLLPWKYYPLDDYKHAQTIGKSQELYANISLNYKILPSVSFDLKGQYQYQRTDNETLNDLQSFITRDRINLFSQLNYSTGVVTYIVPKGGMRSTVGTTIESYTGRGQFNFSKTWGQHQLTAIAGTEVRSARTSGNSVTAYGYNSDPLTASSVDYINAYKTFVTGGTQTIPGAPSYNEQVAKFVSLYANAAYTYEGKYILSGSVRKDGSNIFGASTNDRWNPLWSVGGAWTISSERFYQSALLPVLELRVTYGYSGNVDISRSAVAVGNYGTAPTTGYPYARISVLNNPDLRWERSGMFNIGVHFATKERIFTGTIEYYHKKGTDLYGPSPIDYTAWGSSNQVTKNVANMKGDGVDVQLHTENIRKSLQWNTDILFNYNRSIVTDYFAANSSDITQKFGGGTAISPVIGRDLYGISAYRWGGLDAAGNPQGYLNGVLSTNYSAMQTEATTKGVDGNIVYIGPSTPKIFGSLINNFAYKNFFISVNIGYKLGYYFKRSNLSYTQLVNSGIGHSDYSIRWQKPGDELTTNVPSFVYPNNTARDNFYGLSEVNVLKADHIRLQYINLGYTFYDRKGKLPFGNMDVYINVSNLGILWRANQEKLDPEYPASIPPEKTIAFGIRTHF